MALSQQYMRAGAFVPTTNVWDVSHLKEMDINSPEFKELLVQLYQNINNIANVLNIKEGGYYVQQPFVTGALYYPNPAMPTSTPNYRQEQRVVIDFGALPNTSTKSVPHGMAVGAKWTLTQLYAGSTDPNTLSFLPIPYASATTADIIELNADATNVNITTNSDKTAYTVTYVVMKFLTT
jgi:hypothetical protein